MRPGTGVQQIGVFIAVCRPCHLLRPRLRRNRILPAYEFRSPMIRTSASPLPVGSVASQSTIAAAAAVRVRLQLPWPSSTSGSPTPQRYPSDLRWLTTTVSLPPVAVSPKVCARAGRLRVSMKAGSTLLSKMA